MAAKIYGLKTKSGKVIATLKCSDDTPIAMYGGRVFGSLTDMEKTDLLFEKIKEDGPYYNPTGPTLQRCRGPGMIVLEWTKRMKAKDTKLQDLGTRINQSKGAEWKLAADKKYRDYDGKSASFAARQIIKDTSECRARDLKIETVARYIRERRARNHSQEPQ